MMTNKNTADTIIARATEDSREGRWLTENILQWRAAVSVMNFSRAAMIYQGLCVCLKFSPSREDLNAAAKAV